MSGLRFDRVDPRLYMQLGEKIGNAYVRGKAADANAEGMQQSEQYEPGTAEAADPNGLAPEGYTPDPGKKQYGLGKNPTEFRDTAYTADEKRQSGLRAQQAFYQGRGDTDQAEKIRSQLQGETKEAQDTIRFNQGTELHKLQTAGLNRTAAREDIVDKDSAIEREVDAKIAKDTKAMRVNPDGTERQMSNSDFDSLLLTKGKYLLDAGHSNSAQKIVGEHLIRVEARVKQETASRDKAVGELAMATQAGDFSKVKDFYNTYVHDGAQVTDVVMDAKGVIHVSRKGADGQSLKPSTIGSVAELIKGVESLSKPDSLINYTREMFKDHLEERKVRSGEITAGASATNARANMEYKDAQVGVITDQKTRREDAARIVGAYDALSPEDQAGPKGQGLRNQFNMLNVKDGAAIALGSGRSGAAGAGGVQKRAVDMKPNDDGSYTATDKADGSPLYNMYHGETMPLGMTVAQFQTDKKAAADAGVSMQVGENNGRVEHRFIGADDKPYRTLKEAVAARPIDKPASGGGLAPQSAASKASAQGQSGPLEKPPFYVGIEKEAKRGSVAYSFRGKSYPTEQDALAAYYATTQGK